MSDGGNAEQRSHALFRRQHALKWARDLGSAAPAGGRRDSERWRLHYMLSVHDREARLSVFRIRRLEDGGDSRPERYADFRGQALAPPSFWDDVDAAAALALRQDDHTARDGYSLGPRARDTLLALARAGRLCLAPAFGARQSTTSPRGPVAFGERHRIPADGESGQGLMLKPGPALAARLEWLAEPSPPDGGAAPLRLHLLPSVPADKLLPVDTIYSPEPCYLDRQAGILGPLVTALPPALMAWLRSAPPVPPEATAEVAMVLHGLYLSRPSLHGVVPELPGQAVRELKTPPRFVLGLFTTDTSSFRNRPRPRTPSLLVVSLAAEYAGQRVEPLRLATIPVASDAEAILVICDRGAERGAVSCLRHAVQRIAGQEEGFNFAPVKGGGRRSSGGGSSGWLTVATVPADSMAAARIKHELADALAAGGWAIVDHSELPTRVLTPDALEVGLLPARVGERDGDNAGPGAARGASEDWFELQSGMRIGKRRIDLAPLLATIFAAGGFDAWAKLHCPQGVLWLKLSDSEVLRLDSGRLEPLARVVADWARWRDARGAGDGGEHAGEPRMVLNSFAAAQLAQALEITDVPVPVHKLGGVMDALQRLAPALPAPSFLAELRPYQQLGLAWLRFIAQAGVGGILADDMGLGKTIQVLAHLDCERADGRLADPVLVVAPTSVLFNWQAEAARFAPRLRVLTSTGPDRRLGFDELGQHDLVLTSYALLPRDAGALRARRWHAVILDEAQMIKNPATQAAAAVRGLSASHRLALTGTPLENHLGELWSIMHFVLPGLLGPEAQFRNRFRTPIEKHPGTETAGARLRALERRVRPFLLRRTKQAVLADLPPRTEIIQRVELPTEQRDLYESIRAAMDKRVRAALARAGLARSRIVLLDALLKLRQACCDPALVHLPGARRVTRSAKRDALIDLLATLVDEGRKALVFSQFTSMLDLIEVAIDSDSLLASVPRSRLDGATLDRGAAVERFQQGDAQILLLSLKAGGVGLNLTAADTVILYDPWWNPAVESQAADRAHRIGQHKPVFVHKLIAMGTVEERILALQVGKAELAAAVLSGSLAAGDKALSQEDLLGLFEPI